MSPAPPDSSDFPDCFWNMNCPIGHTYYIAPLPSTCTVGDVFDITTRRSLEELFDGGATCYQSNDCQYLVVEDYTKYVCK